MVLNVGHYIKDLRVIRNRNLRDMIIIDDTIEAFSLQIENAVPIM